jgi:hypothetical protein
MTRRRIPLPHELQPLWEVGDPGSEPIKLPVEPLTLVELEAALRVGLEGPFTPMTADDWAELRRIATE